MSTYPPRQHGTATFTRDLSGSDGDREIVALHPPDAPTTGYPLEVHHRVRRDELADYLETARGLRSCANVVSIQHDDDSWGGPDGSYVLDFVGALQLPAVATLHSVHRRPSDGQREVLTRLLAMTAESVVMSRSAAAVLTQVYDADPSRVSVIPHGIPELPFVDQGPMKLALGVDGRRVILSHGLLSVDKGYASVIAALPAIVAVHPSALFVIVGPTHPDRLRTDGEADRDDLVALVARLRLEEHVRFVDKFVGRVEMIRWLEAADVVVTPYADLDHDVSGILACAMGAGRVVVATPFAYAVELLADGRGVVVDAESSDALAAAIIRVLADDELRETIGRNAYLHSRPMIWSAVGAAYRALFARVGAPPPPAIHRPRRLAALQV